MPVTRTRPAAAPHAFVLGLAMAIIAPLLALAAFTTSEGTPTGRVLALAAPWRADVEIAGHLGAAGAEWVLPLRLPGAWLARMQPEGASAARRGILLFPIGEGWGFLAGCAPASLVGSGHVLLPGAKGR